MNKVILISGDGKVDDFKKQKTDLFNPERYNAFRNVFREENFGFVEAGDLKEEILTGKPSPIYLLDNNLHPYRSPQEGLESELVIASNFENNGNFLQRDEAVFFLNYLERQKQIGIVGNFINSSRSTLFEDKISILELQDKGFSVPRSYLVRDFNSLTDILSSGSQYILKPRYGYSGRGILKIDNNTIDPIKGLELEGYILQKEIDIQSESRLIFFNGEFLGARIIQDRIRPWENKVSSKRKHLVKKYIPSKSQIEESRKILEYSDTVLGCVDWAHDSNENYKFLELNGVGVGLGFSGGPYNLNILVAKKLKSKYLS